MVLVTLFPPPFLDFQEQIRAGSMATGWAWGPDGFSVASPTPFYRYLVGLNLNSANCSPLEPHCQRLSQSSLCSCSSQSASEVSEDTVFGVAPVLCIV